MDWSEPSVYWPELKTPATTTRPLCIARKDSDGFMRIDAIDLVVLVNSCLYLVMKDGQGLRAGQILSRNLDLTRQKGLDPNNLAEQVFAVFDSIYDARRGIGRVHGRYRSTEIPELVHWRLEIDKLLRVSWTLRKTDPEGDAQFVWQAERRLSRHRNDRAAHKVRATGLLARIASLTDRTGRRNTPTIPLQCMAADWELFARVQEVRGIGRRMDWRAMVLEHYIDELRSECWAIRRAAQDALCTPDIFTEGHRIPRALRMRANRMAYYARFLREVQVRTFNRVFTHVAGELENACELLHDAAERRSADRLDRVRELLSRIYRSMMLADEHWRLQEILAVVAEHHHQSQPLSREKIDMFGDELADSHRILTSVDPMTGDHIDKGLERNVLPVVCGEIVLARADLQNSAGVFLPGVYRHLKKACEPL